MKRNNNKVLLCFYLSMYLTPTKNKGWNPSSNLYNLSTYCSHDKTIKTIKNHLWYMYYGNSTENRLIAWMHSWCSPPGIATKPIKQLHKYQRCVSYGGFNSNQKSAFVRKAQSESLSVVIGTCTLTAQYPITTTPEQKLMEI